MTHKIIGQETFGFSDRRICTGLDDLSSTLNWSPFGLTLKDISNAAKGQAGWPPLCLFKALLLSMWYDLSDVKLERLMTGRLFVGSVVFRAMRRRRSGRLLCASGKSWFAVIWARRYLKRLQRN